MFKIGHTLSAIEGSGLYGSRGRNMIRRRMTVPQDVQAIYRNGVIGGEWDNGVNAEKGVGRCCTSGTYVES